LKAAAFILDRTAVLVQQPEALAGIELREFQDFLVRELLSFTALPCRVADHRRVVADQEDHLMAETLEAGQLGDRHHMSYVQAWTCGICADIDTQALALRFGSFEFLLKLGAHLR